MKKTWTMVAMALIVSLMLVVAGCGGGSTPAKAPEAPKFPTKQIEIIVPAGAGGGTDMLARALANKAKDLLGQPVVIVNKPGGSGTMDSGSTVSGCARAGWTSISSASAVRTHRIRIVPEAAAKDHCAKPGRKKQGARGFPPGPQKIQPDRMRQLLLRWPISCSSSVNRLIKFR